LVDQWHQPEALDDLPRPSVLVGVVLHGFGESQFTTKSGDVARVSFIESELPKHASRLVVIVTLQNEVGDETRSRTWKTKTAITLVGSESRSRLALSGSWRFRS
jgi:hypothetical protein